MKDNKYKIVFIDIDGTLVDDSKQIPKENIEVINKLKENGIIPVLCSGRPVISVKEISKQCGATPYVIASGGAIVKDIENGIEIFKKEIPVDIAIKILNTVRTHQIYNAFMTSGQILIERTEYKTNNIARKDAIIIEDVEKILKENKESILQFTPDDFDKEKMEVLREDLVKIPNIYIGKVDEYKKKNGKDDFILYYFDIMAKDITKAEAIKRLLAYLKINKEEAIGIGDGLNDIEMFDAVGYKIAMGNAATKLKEKADMVTTSNNEAGFAKALEKFLS